ncbi:hypothetical protein BOX15_Mlig007642g2 [Macrostomum lignano]|uniref:Uncharacterized protein n=1 Tax=Macrostomum lignano TaxID=282301 RepID=A0A267G6Y8_9PLAT|nr:hypothetical protein BOX15_Mlig007642g2 [Macrostomum lignano]
MHQVIVFHLLMALAVTMCVAAPPNDCPAILQKGGASERFPGLVAHGIHSLTVGDLKFYFKADVTSANTIPTVNANLQDGQAILFNAPDIPIDPMFATPGMRALDRVLSHMDNPNYDIREYNTLDRVVHALHMHEVWHGASVEYAKLVSAPPSKDVCRCATDIDNNGVMEVLRLIALEVREPNLMYGRKIKLNNGTVQWSGNLYRYRFFSRSIDKPLRNPSEVNPHIVNQKIWLKMKKDMLTSMLPKDDYELALYLYCALNV